MIIACVLGLVLLRVFYLFGEMYYERDWPRRTWRGLITALALLLLCASAFAQTAARIDIPLLTSGPYVPLSGGPLPQALWVANSKAYLCAHPSATLGACQASLITTYTDATMGTPCSTSVQLVQLPGNSCVSATGAAANIGAWIAPSSLPFDYWLVSSYGTYGPFTFNPATGSSVGCPTTGCTFTGPIQVGTSVYIADGSVPASGRAFGVKCDGVTDDTAAIQAGVAWESANHGTLTLPTGTCNITAPITIPFTQYLVLEGQCKLCTTIRQMTNNTPIIVAQHSDSHSVTIQNLQLQWSTHQDTTRTLSYGIEWTDITGSNADGYYNWIVRNVQIDGAYIAMGEYTLPGNQMTVWNSHFESIKMTNTSHSAISLVPSGPIGQPENTFVQIVILDTGGGAPVPDSCAICLAASEATFIGLDIEGWKDITMEVFGGGFVNVAGLHIEHQIMSSTGHIFEAANGPFTVEGATISLVDNQTVTSAQIAYQGPGARIRLHGVTFNGFGLTGNMYWTTATAANSIDFSALLDTFGTLASPVGVVPLTAYVEWPEVYPFLKRNQTVPTPVQLGSTNGSAAAYVMNLGPDAASPGQVWYRWTGGSNIWHVYWMYSLNGADYHIQKCADVTGTAAGPPTTLPTGCTELFLIDSVGSITASGAFKNLNGTVIPSAATGSTGTNNVVLSNSPTLVTPALGAATFTSLTNGGNTTPVVGSPAVGQAACVKSSGPPVLLGVCSTVVSAGGACTCI